MSSDHELLVEEDQQQRLERDLTGRTSPSRGSYGTFNGRLPAYSSPAPSTISETKTRNPKRYRLAFLILLGFDVSLVTFLSIISYLNSSPSDHQIATYFTINLNSSVFDLVMLSVIRFILDFLFYLLLGWITRIVLCITTLISTFYIPAKAFFYWKRLNNDNSDIQYILILLLLFAAFVMPWLIAFFFEFKYLPTEIARLSITSWKDMRPWFCPWMLVRPVITRNTTGPQVQQLPHQLAPLNRFQSLDSVFRTPLSSLRTSPIGFQTIEDLTPINEERSISPSPECDQLSSTDEMYIQQGSEALERLRIMTSSNDGWVLEKNQNGIKCFSYQGESRKIWKSEVALPVPVEQLWTVLFHQLQRSHEWNSNVVLNEVVHSVDHKTDVVYTVSSSVGPVSPRDFVSVRRWSLIEGTYYCASVSTLHESRPPQRDKVRGENGPCGYVVIPVDSQSSLFLWLLDTDIKGWVPQSIVDQTMTSTLMTANTNLRMYLRSAN